MSLIYEGSRAQPFPRTHGGIDQADANYAHGQARVKTTNKRNAKNPQKQK